MSLGKNLLGEGKKIVEKLFFRSCVLFHLFDAAVEIQFYHTKRLHGIGF